MLDKIFISKDDVLEKLFNLNFSLILSFLMLFGVGIIMLYSVDGGSFKPWAIKQIIFFAIFFPIAILIACVNIKFIIKYNIVLYYIGVFLLLFVEIKGHKAMGAARWINFGFFKLQPSELMKLFLILYLGRYFYTLNVKDIKQNKNLIKPIIYYAIPCILILKQPNLGTALIISAIAVGIFFLVGVQIWKFILSSCICLFLLPIVWFFGLKDYQKQRVLTFLNPENDPLNSGYNIIQSKIAIGSGGVWGKGFVKGTQAQLEFLPEKHTDFIFTVLSEEFGFIGVVGVIIIYIIIFLYCIFIINNCIHSFGKIVVGGIFINLFCHFFINLGMVSGILPVVGTPLPLLSYGGSITASTLLSLGFILNIDLNKNEDLGIIK